jgi:hypothetical protein
MLPPEVLLSQAWLGAVLPPPEVSVELGGLAGRELESGVS